MPGNRAGAPVARLLDNDLVLFLAEPGDAPALHARVDRLLVAADAENYARVDAALQFDGSVAAVNCRCPWSAIRRSSK